MLYIYNNKFISPLSILIAKYIFIKYKIESKIINDFSKINTTQQYIVLPIGIEPSKECSDNNIKGTLVSDNDTYNILDDKIRCYEFVKTLNIPIIPSFSCNQPSNNINFFISKFEYDQVFIAKESLSKGSNGILLLTKSDLINKCANNELNAYIIQPYLDNNRILSFNMVCKNGTIISSLLVKQETLYNKNNIIKKNITTTKRTIIDSSHDLYQRIQFYCSQIISKTGFNGICEIEFLFNKNDESILFLEVNPRISGHIMLIYKGDLVYIDQIIIPYINTVYQGNNRINKYNYLKSSDELYLNQAKNQDKNQAKNQDNMDKDGYNLKILGKILFIFIVCVIITVFILRQ
jgi:carbamoylphosphate synthase large subunit